MNEFNSLKNSKDHNEDNNCNIEKVQIIESENGLNDYHNKYNETHNCGSHFLKTLNEQNQVNESPENKSN